MKILFHLPPSTLDQCFAGADLERLQTRYEVVLPSRPAASDGPDAFARYAATGAAGPDHPELRLLQENFTRHAASVEAMVTGWGTPPMTVAMLDAARRLKVIVHAAGSIRGLLPAEVWTRGIRVGTANGALATGVAETTLGMIIAGLKGFFPARDWTRQGNWHDPRLGTDRVVTRELFGTIVGVISASKVGQHLIHLLRQFEVDILLHDPLVTEERARALGVRRVTLDELVRRSEVVTLHAPSLPSTRHLLRREHFRAMKDRAIFINTARGAIVDEAALVAELKTGRISAFIDVTDPEPPSKDHPFRTLPNVVLTPHIAGATSNGCRRQGRSAVDQLLEVADGRPMHGEVAAEMAPTMA